MIEWFRNLFRKKNNHEPTRVQVEPARVQAMVTKKMRNELCQLGWTKFEVDVMSPQTAADVIARQQSPERK